jgi:hypothetical protein
MLDATYQRRWQIHIELLFLNGRLRSDHELMLAS